MIAVPGLPHPDGPPDAGRPALTHAGRIVTYGELAGLVERAAVWLTGRGVATGDRVALRMPKGTGFVVGHLAALQLGAIVVPLNPASPDAELAPVLADAAPRLCLGPGDVAALLDAPAAEQPVARPAAGRVAPPAPAPRADDGAALLYTSGTTGRPKGVLLTHANLAANSRALHAAWGWRADDVLLHALPLFHVHGLFVALHGALAAGAHTILHERFDAGAVAAALAEHPVSVFMGVPTMYHRLAALPPSARPTPRALRLLVSGSAPLAPATAEAVHTAYGQQVLERYGMTEALMISSQSLAGPRRPGSVGRPLPGMEVSIVDTGTGTPCAPDQVGAVRVRGAHLFAGYRDGEGLSPPPVDTEGWFDTGDLGSRDEAGELSLVGRRKELIISGGFNVYPAEVEAALDEHADVAESAVIGLPDVDLGELVAAVIVVRDERPADRAALVAHCASRLAPAKRPRRLAFAEALPRNAMGKLQRAALAALFDAGEHDGGHDSEALGSRC